jgi:uncharacterized protein YjaG (DUF416 family)
MAILKFDELELLRTLDGLPPRLRATFAAACAQRQISNYARFAARTKNGNPELLTQVMDQLWKALKEESHDNAALNKYLDLCMSLIPDAADDHTSTAGTFRCTGQRNDAETGSYADRRKIDS